MVGGVSQLISFLQKSLSTEKDEDEEEEKVNDEEEYDELTAVCTPGG